MKAGDTEINATGSLFPEPASRPFVFDGNPTGKPLGVSDGRESRETLAAKVAAMFTARPGEWIDGRAVMRIAGAYGWRTRISDCRRAPFNLNIVNRQRRVNGYTVSEYMLVPAASEPLGGAA